MAYTVDFTDSTKTAITVANASVDTTTSIGLVGQGYKNYGEVVAEDLLHLLENFAGVNAPSTPIEGQIWFDQSTKTLNYLDNTVVNGANWKSIANMTVQSEPPIGVGEKDGDFWTDTDTGMINVYYNGSWIAFSDLKAEDKVIVRTRLATDGNTYRTIETIINGFIVSIVSADDVDPNGWEPAASEYLEDGSTVLTTHFPYIRQGINLNIANDYVFNGTATAAQYADLAERYSADAAYPYGTVVKLGGSHEVTQTTGYNCPDVFGIVSDNPAYLMNSGAGNQATHPAIALAGRIPVRVIGKVNKGDRLVASDTPGHARAADHNNPNLRTVIGRALENKINDAAGIIEAVVGTK
jgi:hypothetical protein